MFFVIFNCFQRLSIYAEKYTSLWYKSTLQERRGHFDFHLILALGLAATVAWPMKHSLHGHAGDPCTSSLSIHGSLIEMQNLSPHPRPAEPESTAEQEPLACDNAGEAAFRGRL